MANLLRTLFLVFFLVASVRARKTFRNGHATEGELTAAAGVQIVATVQQLAGKGLPPICANPPGGTVVVAEARPRAAMDAAFDAVMAVCANAKPGKDTDICNTVGEKIRGMKDDTADGAKKGMSIASGEIYANLDMPKMNAPAEAFHGSTSLETSCEDRLAKALAEVQESDISIKAALVEKLQACANEFTVYKAPKQCREDVATTGALLTAVDLKKYQGRVDVGGMNNNKGFLDLNIDDWGNTGNDLVLGDATELSSTFADDSITLLVSDKLPLVIMSGEVDHDRPPIVKIKRKRCIKNILQGVKQVCTKPLNPLTVVGFNDNGDSVGGPGGQLSANEILAVAKAEGFAFGHIQGSFRHFSLVPEDSLNAMSDEDVAADSHRRPLLLLPVPVYDP